MKLELKLALLAFVLAVAASLCWGFAQDNEKYLPRILATNYLENAVSISHYDSAPAIILLESNGVEVVSINCTNGSVTIATNLTLNDASRAFWEILPKAFPGVRREMIHSDVTNLVNLLVTSGDFCRIRGHVWRDSEETVFIPTELTTHRTCGVCGTNQFRIMPKWPTP